MVKRNRQEGHQWLKEFQQGPSFTAIEEQGAAAASLGVDLMYLTHDIGLYVEIAQEAAGFVVRCYPNYRPAQWRGLQPAAAYAGGQLKRCVHQAVLDYRALQSKDCIPVLVAREMVRWVE